MNLKCFILLICSYIIAFSINFMPSLKYPDANIHIFNLFATAFFLIVLLLFTIKEVHTKRGKKRLNIFLICGVLAGVLIYVIKMFEDFMFDYAILDAIAAIQYPLYLIFITPLFGANFLFNLSYAAFALLMSLFYMLILIVAVTFNKKGTRNY